MKKPTLINSHTVFISTLIIGFTIGLLIYLFGLKNHSSLYHNALVTTTALSCIFFIFVFIGLYNGWKLKDTLGDMTNHFSKISKRGEVEGFSSFDSGEFPEVGEGLEGCLLSIVIWIVIGFFGSIILWSIGAFFWAVILIFAGLLYWIFFRAFRLIFKRSKDCKGSILKSFQIALGYSLLYVSWIYAVIYLSHRYG